MNVSVKLAEMLTIRNGDIMLERANLFALRLKLQSVKRFYLVFKTTLRKNTKTLDLELTQGDKICIKKNNKNMQKS